MSLKNDARFLFSTKDIAEIFSVTYTSLENWNLPQVGRLKGQDQRQKFYDIRAVVKARLSQSAGSGPTKELILEQAELAKTRRELLELKLGEQRGELINASAARDDFFKIGRTFRDAMLSIPNRVATILAAEQSPHAIHNRLTDEISEACTCLNKLPPSL